MLFLIIILAFDFLSDHILQDHREKYFFAESEEIGQHQYQEQLIPPNTVLILILILILVLVKTYLFPRFF